MILYLQPMLPRSDRARQHNPEVYGNDITTYRSTYSETGPNIPQLVLVEQPEPGSALLPHYHASDQFQVFMDGGGQLGKHSLQPLAIHYTNKFTGYGPIVAGPQGVAYYVFRPAADPLGAGQYVHRVESRQRIKDYTGRRRMLMADGIAIAQTDALARLDDVATERLFAVGPEEPDAGTFADIVSLGRNRRITLADPANGGGQVVLVLAGGLRHEGGELEPRSAIALTRDESSITLQAGEAGAQVLVMQYPRPHS
ncbi:MAG: hypothetical protein M0R28_15725 [Pigmentiphaga sp.]|nr:hypothetical protein [Pigmentiphaga sp.]